MKQHKKKKSFKEKTFMLSHTRQTIKRKFHLLILRITIVVDTMKLFESSSARNTLILANLCCAFMLVHWIQYPTSVSSFCAQTPVSSGRSSLYPQSFPVVPTSNLANDEGMMMGSSCSGLFYNKNNRHYSTFRYRQAKRSSTKLHMGIRDGLKRVLSFRKDKVDGPMCTQVDSTSSDEAVNVPGIKLMNTKKKYSEPEFTSNDTTSSIAKDTELSDSRKSTQDIIHRVRTGQLTREEKENFFYAALSSGNTVSTRKPAIIRRTIETVSVEPIEVLTPDAEEDEEFTLEVADATLEATPEVTIDEVEDIQDNSADATEMNEKKRIFEVLHQQCNTPKRQAATKSNKDAMLGERLGAAAFAAHQKKVQVTHTDKVIEEEKQMLIQKSNEMDETLMALALESSDKTTIDDEESIEEAEQKLHEFITSRDEYWANRSANKKTTDGSEELTDVMSESVAAGVKGKIRTIQKEIKVTEELQQQFILPDVQPLMFNPDESDILRNENSDNDTSEKPSQAVSSEMKRTPTVSLSGQVTFIETPVAKPIKVVSVQQVPTSEALMKDPEVKVSTIKKQVSPTGKVTFIEVPIDEEETTDEGAMFFAEPSTLPVTTSSVPSVPIGGSTRQRSPGGFSALFTNKKNPVNNREMTIARMQAHDDSDAKDSASTETSSRPKVIRMKLPDVTDNEDNTKKSTTSNKKVLDKSKRWGVDMSKYKDIQ